MQNSKVRLFQGKSGSAIEYFFGHLIIAHKTSATVKF